VPLRSRSPLLPVHPLDARGARLSGIVRQLDRRSPCLLRSPVFAGGSLAFPFPEGSIFPDDVGTKNFPGIRSSRDARESLSLPLARGREREGGRGLEGESYRVSGATRTCDSCVRTSAARGETGMIIPVDALAHCHCCTRDGHERRGRVIPCGCTNRLANRRVPSFGTCTRLPARGFSRHGPRERRRLLLVRGSASLKSSIYLPIFITA